MNDSGVSEPAQFYTGIVAEIYGHLRSITFDPGPFARLIRRYGEPALELGCGDGDPLLALVAEGLHVEGLDSSLDMLERCRAAAMVKQLNVELHHSTMEAMDLGRRFNTIYLAGPTFNLLVTDDAARHALERIKSHLLPGGVALIPLLVPLPTPAAQIGRARSQKTEGDHTTMRFTVVSEKRDEVARTQTAMLRYEVVVDEVVSESVERDWVLHWHSPDNFASLASEAGLEVVWKRTLDGSPVTDESTSFSFLLTPTSLTPTSLTPTSLTPTSLTQPR
jgi:SAM-dependent methyltransferase